ncbi:hypothetical protein CTI12_AA493330 [Artemisia annua]|uniref:Helitron helicase-like domain-containing protein n=1 Tax=Artemisia annua TaxID=35608 RepID=A0A2U1LGS8_ARTAN|nr:hypothetical protein CTI12_AA493330 [Artemisia annua]
MIINVQWHRIRVIPVDRLIAQRKYPSDKEKQCWTREMIYYFQEKILGTILLHAHNVWQKYGQLKRVREECQQKNGDSFSICCMNGTIKLDRMIDPPEELLRLFKSDDKRSKFFQHDIRKFNMMFSFTSMGGNVDRDINKGGGPFIFRISGQNYHLHGTVLPRDEEIPKFAQLYIVDTCNEISNRYAALSSKNEDSPKEVKEIDRSIAVQIKEILNSYNALVKDYRAIGEQIDSNNASTVKIRLISRKESDADKNKEKLGKNYDLPTANEVAAIVVGDIDGSIDKRDIIVQAKNGEKNKFLEKSVQILGTILLHAHNVWQKYGQLKRVREECQQKNGDSFSICCMNGTIKLDRMIDPPEELLRLFKSDDKRSKFFQHDIRKFNMMFSFTSMGGNVDRDINKGGGPFIFRISGQNYHLHGTVLPRDEEIPKFAQLYIVDTCNEISNRYAALR